MSEESNTEKTTENEMTISVQEYNQLTSKINSIADLQKELSTKNESISELTAKLEELSKPKNSKSKEPEATREQIEADIRKAVQDEINSYKTQNEKLQTTLKNKIVTDQVLGALRTKGLLPDLENYIRTDIDKYCKLEGDDFEQANIVIVDDQGNSRWSSKNAGQKLSIQELADEWVSEKPAFFSSGVKQSPGNFGGNTKTSSGVAGITNDTFRNMPREKQDELLKDPEIRKQLLNQSLGG